MFIIPHGVLVQIPNSVISDANRLIRVVRPRSSTRSRTLTAGHRTEQTDFFPKSHKYVWFFMEKNRLEFIFAEIHWHVGAIGGFPNFLFAAMDLRLDAAALSRSLSSRCIKRWDKKREKIHSVAFFFFFFFFFLFVAFELSRKNFWVKNIQKKSEWEKSSFKRRDKEYFYSLLQTQTFSPPLFFFFIYSPILQNAALDLQGQWKFLPV